MNNSRWIGRLDAIVVGTIALAAGALLPTHEHSLFPSTNATVSSTRPLGTSSVSSSTNNATASHLTQDVPTTKTGSKVFTHSSSAKTGTTAKNLAHNYPTSEVNVLRDDYYSAVQQASTSFQK